MLATRVGGAGEKNTLPQMASVREVTEQWDRALKKSP